MRTQGKRQDEWEYLSNPVSKNSIIEVLNVKDAVVAYGNQYFQDQLSRIEEDTIDIWLVGPEGVKSVAVEWNFNKPDDERETYLVDENGIMLGYLSTYNIDKTGYKKGDKARAAISKPPSGGQVYALQILKHPESPIIRSESTKEV